MAWTKRTRLKYARRTARYPSDMTDRKSRLVCPLLPMPRRPGRPRSADLRGVVNALALYCHDTLPVTNAAGGFSALLNRSALFQRVKSVGLDPLNYHLVIEARKLEGKEASLTAGVIDSQSVKTTERSGITRRSG